MHRHDHAQRRVDVLELLAGEAEADVVHAGAAVFLRHRDAEQAELRHAAEDALAIEAVLPIVFPDVRRDLARAPFADRLLEQALFVRSGRKLIIRRQILSRAGNGQRARAAGDARRAAPDIELAGRARAVGGDLEMVGAAEERAHLARRRVGVGRDDLRHLIGRPTPMDEPLAAKRVERAAIDVRDEIAEAIDAHDLAVDADRRPRGLGTVEALHAPGGRPSADSSMPLASHAAAGAKRSRPFERAAHRRPRVPPLGQLDDALRRMLVEDGRQHAVVGRDEPVVAGFGRDAAARRSDAGIDDDEKDRAGRKVAVRGRQLERAGDDVVRRAPRARCRRASRPGKSRARRPSSCRRSGRACRSRSAAR